MEVHFCAISSTGIERFDDTSTCGEEAEFDVGIADMKFRVQQGFNIVDPNSLCIANNCLVCNKTRRGNHWKICQTLPKNLNKVDSPATKLFIEILGRICKGDIKTPYTPLVWDFVLLKRFGMLKQAYQQLMVLLEKQDVEGSAIALEILNDLDTEEIALVSCTTGTLDRNDTKRWGKEEKDLLTRAFTYLIAGTFEISAVVELWEQLFNKISHLRADVSQDIRVKGEEGDYGD